MLVLLEIDLDKESPLAFLNSLQTYLKEKKEKKDLQAYSASIPVEQAHAILFAETDEKVADPCGDRIG